MITQMNLQKMKRLMEMTENNLREYLYKELKKFYTKIIYNKNYLIAVGTGEMCLISHLDTVFRSPPTFFFHDKEQNILWSPEGMGADDRAGVYAILEILETGARPHIIFTTGEEVGCVGARYLIADFPKIKPIMPDVKFLVQLDRQGKQDSVYYDCDNEIFEKWINKFGFRTEVGSYTDISIFGPEWGLAAVNLSIGYYNEHTKTEILFYNYTIDTINKVLRMINKCEKGQGPKNAKYVPMTSQNIFCPICNKNKITKDSVNISQYGLGVNLICQSCYNEYFKD